MTTGQAAPLSLEASSRVHLLTAPDRIAMRQMRALVESHKGEMRGVAARPAFDAIIGRTAAPEGVTYKHDRIGGVSGWWCEPSEALPDAVILHLHGGWFNWGSAEAFRHLVGQIARSAGVRAFVPDYRLAPEHPFPAGATDVQACFEGLAPRYAGAIAVTGDSAGGNLALGLLPLHREQIAACVALSPVTDLTLTGDSWISQGQCDPYFVREQAHGLIAAYLADQDPTQPLASPLLGDLRDLPPIQLHVGNDEVLRDDSVRYAERASAAGADITLDVWEGMVHGFLGSVGHLQAADAALQKIGAFLANRLGG